MLTTGGEGRDTFRGTSGVELLPPSFIQLKRYLYVFALFRTPVLLDPLLVGTILRLPGQSPIAVQTVPEVLFDTPQFKVALLPTSIDEGLTVKEIAGGSGNTNIVEVSKDVAVELTQEIL